MKQLTFCLLSFKRMFKVRKLFLLCFLFNLSCVTYGQEILNYYYPSHSISKIKWITKTGSNMINNFTFEFNKQGDSTGIVYQNGVMGDYPLPEIYTMYKIDNKTIQATKVKRIIIGRESEQKSTEIILKLPSRGNIEHWQYIEGIGQDKTTYQYTGNFANINVQINGENKIIESIKVTKKTIYEDKIIREETQYWSKNIGLTLVIFEGKVLEYNVILDNLNYQELPIGSSM